MHRVIRLGLLVLIAASAASADTIVLKSGRKITATNVVEEGDRVYYETPAGRLSFPKSAVERIERGGTYSSAGGSRNAEVEVPAAVPGVMPSTGFEDVFKAAVKNGSIDREYISKLESESQGGDSRAAERVVVAHHAAAQFEVNAGNLDAAIGHYRRALTYSPEHLGALLMVSYLYLRRSEFTPALEYLERARRVAPDSPDVAAGLGWAYYRQNKVDLAVKEWKRSLQLRPDANVQRALEKAERDMNEEASYREGESRHFQLRYNGAQSPGLAKEILRTLEQHFQDIENALSFSPPERIGVILYTEQAFMDVTRAPGWAGALNDGRIRVPVQGLTSMTGDLSRTLKHELTHSFVFQKTRERCPVWLNEGIAQYLEGKRSDENAAALVQIYESGRSVSLGMMEGYWVNLPPQAAAYAYAWSLAGVEYIIRTNGMGDIERILERLPSASSPEEAVRSVLRSGYADLEKETATWLKKTYVK
jgi:tetratricopeptide (TPR) repeat protein